MAKAKAKVAHHGMAKDARAVHGGPEVTSSRIPLQQRRIRRPYTVQRSDA